MAFYGHHFVARPHPVDDPKHFRLHEFFRKLCNIYMGSGETPTPQHFQFHHSGNPGLGTVSYHTHRRLPMVLITQNKHHKTHVPLVDPEEGGGGLGILPSRFNFFQFQAVSGKILAQ